MDIQKELFAMQDMAYKEFHEKLIPTVNPDTVIGVRVPHIRALAKRIGEEKGDFLKV